ncbi:probable ATP-dependent RNA helicase DDX31 isoform X2 [Citrus clementina]|uniref:probable ATP-dependent RNA helicase DDX31 isoform X2 n=1 Tax=Citrus clementina TaxID=85681 RepID=UPI0003D721D8|nr:probable ATP-dependent RNA helicase DDX31 isoform X2 [Citrus x clementina]
MSKKKETVKEIFASCCFSSLGLDSTLCDQLRERLGFEAPTKVQAQAIPVILSGRDVLVNAATGTGKTVAYLAPIINHLQSYSPRIDRSSGTFALVLVPTSELCLLVYEILQKLLHRFRWIVPGYVMGGGNRSKEKARLRKGISILVATPGHLLDHLKHTSSFLHTNLRWIIFDEADRILELGFGKEIEEILDILGSRNIASIGEGNEVSNVKRQNLLLSATLNEKVNHLTKISLETPVLIGLDEKKFPEDKSNVHFGSLESDVKEEVEHPNTTLSSSTEDFMLPAKLVQRYVKDRSSEDFDAFFNRLRSGSSVTTGSTSLKGTLPLCALGTKIKLHDSSLSDFRGTLGTGKRKVGSLFSLPEDFIEGELDPVANKKVSHLAEYVHYTSENITPEVAGEMDKLGLDECYNRALKASQDVTFLLSRSLQDLAAIANVQLENEKLKSELQSCRSYEEKLSRENKTLKGRLNEVSKEKARMMKDLEELQAKHEDLVSQQKEMIDSVFERIMTEVWSVDPGLVVPRVEKWVDKSAILAAIEIERESCLPQSGSLQRLSGVPQPKSPSRTLTFEAHASATSSAFIDLPIIKDKGEDDLLAM